MRILFSILLLSGENELPGRLLDTKCGRITEVQQPIKSSGGSMRLRFTTDVSVTRQGFVLQYKTSMRLFMFYVFHFFKIHFYSVIFAVSDCVFFAQRLQH